MAAIVIGDHEGAMAYRPDQLAGKSVGHGWGMAQRATGYVAAAVMVCADASATRKPSHVRRVVRPE